MKRLIIFKSLLLFSIASFSQSYQPFDFEKGMWYCRYVSKGGLFGADFERTKYVTDSVKFYCNGDTTINDFVYKKLYYSGFSSVHGLPQKPISGYYSAIRNDNINKKILYSPAGYDAANTGSGLILYDFNLTVGDSIGYNYSTSKKDIVTSIDTVVYCNRAHRRFNTESGWNRLIEGIGSVSGLFPHVSPTDYGTLLCYQEYGNNDCVDCKILTPDDYLAQTFWSKVIDDQHKNLSYITDKALLRDSVILISGVVNNATCYYHSLFAFNMLGKKLWETPGTQDLICIDSNFIYTAGFTFIDDVGGHEQIIISKYDADGKEIFSTGYPEIPHSDYFEFKPTSIDIDREGKITVSSESIVVQTDVNGSQIVETKLNVGDSVLSVASINEESYLITTRNKLYKSNRQFLPSDSVSFAGTIKKTLLQNDTIYALIDNKLLRIDSNLNIIDTLISNTLDIEDIDFYSEDLWFSSFDEGKINLTKMHGKKTAATVTFPKMLNETAFIITNNSFVFTGNSFSNQIGLFSYPRNVLTELQILPDIEFVDFNINKISIEYHSFQGDSIATGYFFTPEVIVKNNSADTIKSFAVFADLHGGFNCGQNFFYTKTDGLEILPGQSQTVTLPRGYQEDIKNNELCFQLLAPNGEIETQIKNNSICKTFTITSVANLKNAQTRIFPNPFSDIINIGNQELEDIQVELLDSNGRLILKKTSKTNPIKLKTTNLKPGIYIVKIRSSETTQTKTLIKQ